MAMSAVAEAGRPWMPIHKLRNFQAARPDEERWELVDGIPLMKTLIYQAHPFCEAVVVVEQHRMEVRLARRSGSQWD